MKCPICKKHLTVIGNMDEYGITTCSDGHYSHDHDYGAHTETFDANGQGFEVLTLSWHSVEDDTTRRKRTALIHVFLEYVLGRGNDSVLEGR